MAGAGYKLFNTGDVLLASEVNTYLQQQTVMVFASSTARTTALSGVLAEGMMSYLQDTNSVEVYNGSSWVNVGNAGDITGVTAGTGISGGGTSGDVTITNSMATAIDAKGDLIVGTGADTFSRLAVGTNGHTLVADSSTATGLKWAAGSTGALTLVSATTFNAVVSHSVNNVFTSNYKYYRALLVFTASAINTMTLRWRASGADNTGNLYYSVSRTTDTTGANQFVATNPNTSSAFLGNYNTDINCVSFDIFDPQSSTLISQFNGNAFSRGAQGGGLSAVTFGSAFVDTTSFDGLTLIASGGTITGTLKIYGYQN